MSVNRLI